MGVADFEKVKKLVDFIPAVRLAELCDASILKLYEYKEDSDKIGGMKFKNAIALTEEYDRLFNNFQKNKTEEKGE